MLDFATVLRAPTFKFLVGTDGACFNVPATLAKDISPPLHALMSGGQMKEAQDGVAVLKEVESETFVGFCEYAYTGTYRVPKVIVDFEQPSQGPPLHHKVRDHTVVDPPPVTDSDLERIRETDSWGFSSKKSKKDKKRCLRPEPVDTLDEEAPSVEISYRIDPDTTKKYHQHLWNNFCNLNYDSVPGESQENLEETTEIEFKPLLFHCRLYVFAQMYLMVSLRQLTLCKLHAALESFHLDLASSDEVLEVIEFAFTNTGRSFDHDDELRKLLVAYAASKTRILKQNVAFRTLLDAHGELGSDIVQALG